MRSFSERFALACIAVLMLSVSMSHVLEPRKVAAQATDRGPQQRQRDMWNPNWMQRDMWGPGRMGPGMQQRMARHWTFMHQGIPAAYRGATNPLSQDAETLEQGRALYQENCASCHGTTGMGDGETANALNPSPALLAYMIQMPMAVDEYMLWSISDGGETFGTDMPAFKDALKRDEIWKIIMYMRAGFPTEETQQ